MTTEQILIATSIALNMDVADIKVRSHKNENVQARMIVTKLMRDRKSSWKAIGISIGDRDHSTVINNYRKFGRDYENNYKGLKDKFDRVKDVLQVKLAQVCSL